LDVIKERSQIKLSCRAAKPKLAMSFIKFSHDCFATPIETVPAMKKVKDIVKKVKANITNGKVFLIARTVDSFTLKKCENTILQF
jgi:hypothetical protein